MRKRTLIEWQKSAAEYITGGMSSSFRANQFTGVPMFVEKADGPKFTDLSGQEYIDFFMCHGAVLLGHNRQEVKSALSKCLDKGYFAGFDSEETIQFAKKICDAVPGVEEIRFVNSGTEGTLLSLRLARGFTGRNKIVRIDGHFHGIHDYLIANNLSGKVDFSNDGTRISKVIGRSSGIPEIIDEVIITLPWNNIAIMEKVFREQGDEIGGIIMNIIDYNNGCFVTTVEYLQAVRNLCDQYGIVLIFDEILSGFKTGLSCGQGYYGVTPDICTLGKALTNDVPLGIVGGKKEIMQKIMDPEDPVISGGTFSGNQLGIAAGNAVLDILSSPGFYDDYLSRVNWFYKELQNLFRTYNFPASVSGLGAGFQIYVGTEECPQSYADLAKVDRDLAVKFFTACIREGLYFHTDFTVSAAHDREILSESLNRFESIVRKMQ